MTVTMTLPLNHLNSLPAANESITLLEDTCQLELPILDGQLAADTRAVLVWGPHRGVRLFATVKDIPVRQLPRFEHAIVRIEDTAVECLVDICKDVVSSDGEREFQLTLIPCNTVDIGRSKDLRRVTFGLINFCDYFGDILDGEQETFWRGRLVLQAGEWRITLDTRQDLSQIKKTLNACGGFAVTHAGELARTDEKIFDMADAEHVIDALHFLLSFVRGHRVSLVLQSGQDVSGVPVWRRLMHPTTDSWSDPLTWFDTQRPGSLGPILCTLLAHWRDEGWRKAFQMGLYWYFLAQKNFSNSDTSVVLSTTGLDLIAWFRLVEDERNVSRGKFERCPMEDRIRGLLKLDEISSKISSVQSNLQEHSASLGWVDGPDALAKLRNAAVHPRRRGQVFDAPDRVRWEASSLALHYLELTLLAMVQYEGTYINRVEHRHSHGLMYVPWVRHTSEKGNEA